MPTTAFPGPGFLLQVDDGTGTAGRSFTDGVTTSGSAVLTSATGAAFVSGDVGRLVTAANVPAGTTILTYTSATSVTMTAPATASQTSLAVALGPKTGTFATINSAKDIKALPLSVDTFDITNQSSPGGYEEVVPTIRRSGDTTFDLIFNPDDAGHDSVTGLQYLMNNKIRRNYQLLIPGRASNAKVPAWEAYVTGFDITGPVAGVLTASVKCKVTGLPVWKVPG